MTDDTAEVSIRVSEAEFKRTEEMFHSAMSGAGFGPDYFGLFPDNVWDTLIGVFTVQRLFGEWFKVNLGATTPEFAYEDGKATFIMPKPQAVIFKLTFEGFLA